MTTYTIEGVKKAIGNVDGKSADEIKLLIIQKGKVPFSKVAAVYKELGFMTARKSYASEFYDLLRAGKMTDIAFKSWISAGSKNVKAHEKHYDGIRILANDIHAAK